MKLTDTERLDFLLQHCGIDYETLSIECRDTLDEAYEQHEEDTECEPDNYKLDKETAAL